MVCGVNLTSCDPLSAFVAKAFKNTLKVQLMIIPKTFQGIFQKPLYQHLTYSYSFECLFMLHENLATKIYNFTLIDTFLLKIMSVVCTGISRANGYKRVGNVQCFSAPILELHVASVT